MNTLGIDIGGSGIKGAPVDTTTGELLAERVRVPTPQPSDVDSVIAGVVEVAGSFTGFDRVGVTFPGVVLDGVVKTAANMDRSWIDADAATRLTQAVGHPTVVLNDADAAGVAEVKFGEGRNQAGVIMMLTFGTGIGSALFVDGLLVPNTELGHLELHSHDAEEHASDRAREEHGLEWDEWGKRVGKYLKHVEMLFTPKLFIIGGGVSKRTDKWLRFVEINTPIVPAALLNNAGIIGAAMAASTLVPSVSA
jgi:polyphosphate glucokinase